MFGKKDSSTKIELNHAYDFKQGLFSAFSQDHRDCDAEWAALEAAVAKADDAEIEARWKSFNSAMRLHFSLEEEVIFPAFENATGMHGSGPTEVMRMEHTQMRGVLDQMTVLIDAKSYEEFTDQGDTLLMLVQQHNSKEEGVLYPAAEQHLTASWAELENKLASLVEQKRG